MTTPAATLALVTAAVPLALHAPCPDADARQHRDAVLRALLGWRDALRERDGFTAEEQAAAANTVGVLLAWLPTAGEA